MLLSRRLLSQLLACSQQHTSSLHVRGIATSFQHQSSSQPPQQFYNVPAGHINSDLSNTKCHIGLGRLRDLTMRQDLRLVTEEGTEHTLGQLFKGKKVVLVGLPDLGSVCASHLPGYATQHADLTKLGVDDVYYVTVGEAPTLASWSAKVGAKIKGLADPKGFFTRALGLEASVESGRSHRCVLVRRSFSVHTVVPTGTRRWWTMASCGDWCVVWACVMRPHTHPRRKWRPTPPRSSKLQFRR